VHHAGSLRISRLWIPTRANASYFFKDIRGGFTIESFTTAILVGRTAMETSQLGRLREHLARRPDPRVDRTTRHLLLAIVVIAVCAVIGGAATWVDIDE
jgi:hypothetical protein